MNNDTCDREMTARWDASQRSPRTGKLYMPSMRWGGTVLMSNGAASTLGGPFDKTLMSMQTKAILEAAKFKATCWVFSRKQEGCRLISVHRWNEKKQNVESRGPGREWPK